MRAFGYKLLACAVSAFIPCLRTSRQIFTQQEDTFGGVLAIVAIHGGSHDHV